MFSLPGIDQETKLENNHRLLAILTGGLDTFLTTE